ncbi:hypothetical protein NE237_027417 [Protea cynaroides]|uniref:4Fe-4S ferredoxin-type domain-containing protein n=1 Tax=Protea cynaroides TaxID=273540 RepID=A0A9Q0JU73_9MAGN|nr:hypothetical protein NE237_027417 [Protea cynaroides]
MLIYSAKKSPSRKKKGVRVKKNEEDSHILHRATEAESMVRFDSNLPSSSAILAEFDPEDCPHDCSRPCEMVCPANAISLELIPREDKSTHGNAACGKFQDGVITERCYGCCCCIPVCPYDKISTLGDSIWHVKLIAVSLPYIGDPTVSTMNKIFSIMDPRLSCYNLWQLDGCPMSGDIGKGATRKSIAFSVHLAALRDRPHGFLQLAGGTNLQTVDGLKKAGLFQTTENGKHILLWMTLDDAIGEAYDMTTRCLTLDMRRGGGPALEELAQKGANETTRIAISLMPI